MLQETMCVASYSLELRYKEVIVFGTYLQKIKVVGKAFIQMNIYLKNKTNLLLMLLKA